METWNRNQYSGLETAEFVVCLESPYGGRHDFTVGEKYKITYRGNGPWEIGIENNYGGQECFNIHSPFGDNFCTLKYLRKKKLEKIGK